MANTPASSFRAPSAVGGRSRTATTRPTRKPTRVPRDPVANTPTISTGITTSMPTVRPLRSRSELRVSPPPRSSARRLAANIYGNYLVLNVFLAMCAANLLAVLRDEIGRAHRQAHYQHDIVAID